MGGVQIGNRLQRVDPLLARLADADQDAGRERHLQFAGQTQRLQPDRGMFVGRTVVNAATLAEPLAGRLQHDALARRHLAQGGDLLARHHAGIGMRQQSGLAQHQRAHRGQIGDRRVVAERLQRVARGLVAQLGLVAQREQRFGATCGRAGARDGEHLVGREVDGLARARHFRERAVVTDVAAELGEGNEDLARIGDQPAVRGIAQGRGFCYQFGQRRVEPPPRLSTAVISSSPLTDPSSRMRLPPPAGGRMVSHRRARCNARKDATNADRLQRTDRRPPVGRG